jgi:hypothetical protein
MPKCRLSTALCQLRRTEPGREQGGSAGKQPERRRRAEAGGGGNIPPVRLSGRDKPRLMLYTIEEHKHRFAAWAASSAASVNKNCRFSVEDGKRILEAAGMNRLLESLDRLPPPQNVDAEHRRWRDAVITAARTHETAFTHGLAAKLINIYLKAGFVCGGHHLNASVQALHPPIDRQLLREFSMRNFGGARRLGRVSPVIAAA